jgi:two-component system chemotaxis response regulator CheB
VTGAPLHVLVVDDSAVVRQALAAILRSAGMVVEVASDPVFAMARMSTSRPDVVVLDVEMPRMDGLTFLRRLMAESPLPVVICSGLAGAGSEVAIRALEEGALAIVEKPRLGVRSFLEESADRLVETVRGVARARVRARGSSPRHPAPLHLLPPMPLRHTTDQVVAIGASTGGTEAIRAILEALPPDCPGIAIVQHMPAGFTAAFAQRLARASRLDVAEARDGDRLQPGRALVAPGNRHLAIRRSGAGYCAHVFDASPVSRHRPSVDVLFRSAAEHAGESAVGVLLTGMGNDGAAGLLAMREAGARTLAQDEATSVVYGMPREAAKLGAVEQVLPLQRIPGAILEGLVRPHRR